MNILIIGGAGFVGANLVRRCLKEEGVVVTVMDCLEAHLHASTANLKPVWNQIRFVRGDMRDESQLAEVIQGQDVIFNCAAQTSHPLSIQYPLLDVDINCAGNLKLLEAVRLLNPSAVLVYVSSSTVIGRAVNQVVDEDHWERPLEIYSANKGVAEKYYQIYHTLYDLKTVILRFANLYGPFGKGYPEFGFINYFIHQAWKGEEIRLFGSGNQMRNLMHVDDVVDILWLSAQDKRLYGKVFFATGDEHFSVKEIAKGIVESFQRGRVTNIEWPAERQRIEIENVRFSSSRLRKITGWSPCVSFSEGLTRTRRILEAMENSAL